MTPEEINAALAKTVEASIKGTPVVTPVSETPIAAVETPVAAVVNTPVSEVIETPVKTEAETPSAETPKGEPVKSFEDYLSERSGGKFKKWEDVENELTPKEVFANEKVKHLNELAAKGVDVTSKEFLELQSLDFDKIDKVDDILFEKWKRGEEGKGLSEKTIRHEINKKYNVNEWIDKADEDLTEDDKANQEKMQRDAGLSKEWLVNYKNERVLDKPIDPAVIETRAKEAKQFQDNWEAFVESNLVNKFSKLSSSLNDKSEFNYDVSEQDRKEVAEVMKGLTKDSNVFFNQFIEKDKDGKQVRNHDALYTMMLKARNYDKAVALAYSDGAAKEALRIEKEVKNTNFQPAQTATTERVFANNDERLKDAVAKMKI